MSWYCLIHNAAENVLTVLLFDDIGCYGKTSGDLASEIAAFAPARIELQIDSTGGDSVTGLNLNALFARYETRAVIRNNCFSASLSAALGAKTIQAASAARFLIHSPAAYVHGTPEEMLDAACHAEKLRSYLHRLLQERTEQPPETVARWLSGDTWLNAEGALSIGLIDEIVDIPCPIANHQASSSSDFQEMTEKEQLFRTWLNAFGEVEVRSKSEFATLLSDWLMGRVKELPTPTTA